MDDIIENKKIKVSTSVVISIVLMLHSVENLIIIVDVYWGCQCLEH